MIDRAVFFFLAFAAGCGPTPRPAANAAARDTMTIEQVLRAHTDTLMAIPGVVGVGQGEAAGRPVVQVLVERLTPALRARLPKTLDGYGVEVVEAGVIRAQDRDTV